ncbi:tetratricopeptide repeat protein [Flavobacterium sp. 3HN19-14]|uniref:tetratricopeptide repeat protein n=1 Tax=Flavobacterium sp. 3HN19-14 TaxID=3448133 RepID=UPI003EE026BA
MATYNKRGYKAPKPKEEKLDDNYIEDVNVDEKDSTTAGVFNTLDETASRTEAFVEKNSKAIFSVVIVITLAVVGYFAYNKFVVEPKETEATNEMYTAQKNFDQALTGQKSDSLFKLALDGAEGKRGFVKLADEYSGTKAGNIATYNAGMAYLYTKQYDKAITYLEQFKADDAVVSVYAKGCLGDAYAEKNDLKKALELYTQAAEMNKNDVTTPRYLVKAGKIQLALKNKAEALKNFENVKDNYSSSADAQGIDALIGLAQ